MSHYFDAELIAKYRMSGPRYTSYPTAVQFTPAFTAEDYAAFLTASNASHKDLSLYFHIPFCEHVCFYCGCNKIITKNHKQAHTYLAYLKQDILWQARAIDASRKVVQIGFGGGTPTFLSIAEMRELMTFIRSQFTFASDDAGEFSIEVDPRTINDDYLQALREMGFNRLSFGVQDFNLAVQQAVNRVQPREEVAALMASARRLQFHSLSADLIYGLPLQTPESFAETIREMIALSPDRLAVFNYAHMPELFGAQKQIHAEELPSAAVKLEILEETIELLTSAGYEFIGLDHFAKPTDSLVIHQQKGTLYRNFQGYSTFSNCDLLGFGISAISQVGDCYAQHEKARSKYYAAIDEKRLPIARGIALTQDDVIRREIITEIMCNLGVDFTHIAAKYHVDAEVYFAPAREKLTEMQADGLLRLTDKGFRIEALGRLLIRNIAMLFDAYLTPSSKPRFSQVI